jgi:hypothetical protein
MLSPQMRCFLIALASVLALHMDLHDKVHNDS